jgi:hypothetical protein
MNILPSADNRPPETTLTLLSQRRFASFMATGGKAS